MQLQIPIAQMCNSWSLFFQCGSITRVTLLDQGSEQENRNNDKLFNVHGVLLTLLVAMLTSSEVFAFEATITTQSYLMLH